MIETLALTAGAVFLAGIGLSVLIAELLRRRDAREAAQRGLAQQKAADRRTRRFDQQRPDAGNPAAAAEMALGNARVATPGLGLGSRRSPS